MIMEITILITGFLFGWFMSQIYIGFKLRRALKKIAEDNGMTLDQLAEMFSDIENPQAKIFKVPNLFTETADNSILLYNKDTGLFMGQAKTLDELAENIYKFDKVKFALVNHDSQEFWFVEGKVKNDLKELE
jgi:hypothetical protein